MTCENDDGGFQRENCMHIFCFKLGKPQKKHINVESNNWRLCWSHDWFHLFKGGITWVEDDPFLRRPSSDKDLIISGLNWILLWQIVDIPSTTSSIFWNYLMGHADEMNETAAWKSADNRLKETQSFFPMLLLVYNVEIVSTVLKPSKHFAQSSPRPNKSWQVESIKKSKLIFFLDIVGIIHEFISPGQFEMSWGGWRGQRRMVYVNHLGGRTFPRKSKWQLFLIRHIHRPRPVWILLIPEIENHLAGPAIWQIWGLSSWR